MKEVIETGNEGGAGNLIVCELLMMHINDDILNDEGRIDQHKIDLVSRLGANWYCRASGNALFEVEKPISNKGIGVDMIPAEIRNSNILTGNNLGQLGNVEQIPGAEEINSFKNESLVSALIKKHNGNNIPSEELHHLAKKFLDEGHALNAWKTLLIDND